MTGRAIKKPRAEPGANERKSQRFVSVVWMQSVGREVQVAQVGRRPYPKLRQQISHEEAADFHAIEDDRDLFIGAILLPLAVVWPLGGTGGIGVNFEPALDEVSDPIDGDKRTGVDA